MPERICTVTGTTTGTNEDITSALKTGMGLASTDALCIRKMLFATGTAQEIYVNDNTKSVQTAEEVASSGVFVIKTDYNEVVYNKIVVKNTGIAWTATVLY